ncbi:thiolase C-terminal domain-containing protein [Gordonia sp. KTR9]|uniref:thiolase C-terminal domain-containing protein n=1 Tax=Gordonia sp. KTR9 TaxID=337191 RepID=UPI00027DDF47|nr:acetyl-CoA acetyltransferase [Gordonia sp. KTR9]AFR49487.1 Acetyl-CoA acetyltransferase [Gordonia sp. KTR9]
MHHFESDVVISGIGQSAVGRRLGRSGLDLTVEATRVALADAGLTRAEVNGLSAYPSMHDDPGFGPVSVYELKEALRLDLDWIVGMPHSMGQFGPIIEGAMAISSGLADHVLCYRTMTESTAQGAAGRAAVTGRPRASLNQTVEYFMPYGLASAAPWVALYMQRYLHEFGASREQFGGLAVAQRKHAMLNPKALFREPMSIEDYLGARMISDPVSLYDCDVPIDGSTVVILSRKDACPRPEASVGIEAVGAGMRVSAYWDQSPDMIQMAATGAAQRLWQRTDLSPSDVDVALLYDGFSYLAITWLEALGFCGRGEGAAFVEGGERISLGGQLPVNTQGGHLSGGRLHGFGMLHEACLQVRGQADRRQVAGAELAVATAGGGPLAGCLLVSSPV